MNNLEIAISVGIALVSLLGLAALLILSTSDKIKSENTVAFCFFTIFIVGVSTPLVFALLNCIN